MGHKKKAPQHETFAEITQDVAAAIPPPEAPESEPHLSPLHDGEYTDGLGVRRRLRRGELRWSRVQLLILDPAVPVLRVYFGQVHEIGEADRAEFAARIRPYLKGWHNPPPGDYTDFEAGEFKDDRHRSLLIVEESC